MLIQHQALQQQLKRPLPPIIVLLGPDPYFVEEEAKTVKDQYKASTDCDETLLTIQSADDWKQFDEEAHSYSLFASHRLLDIRYDKKSMDSQGKKILQAYLEAPSDHCLIVLRAPNIPAKQLLWLSSQAKVLAVSAYPLSESAMRNWIGQQLKQHQIQCSPIGIDLIFYKVQGNMLACAQAIQKISLIHPPGSSLDLEEINQELSDQSDYQLFDLTEACLSGQLEKTIRMIKKFLETPSEYTLLLWLLTQEIRLLLQLKQKLKENISLSDACNSLKIWKQRTAMYQAANTRLSEEKLHQLLTMAYQVDEAIKTSQTLKINHLLQTIALTLCLGQGR